MTDETPSIEWRTRLLLWSWKGRKWRRRVSQTILNTYSHRQFKKWRKQEWGNND